MSRSSELAAWQLTCPAHAPPLSLFPRQLGYALKQGIPYMVLFGDSELAAGVLKVKDLDAGTEETVPEVRPRGQTPSFGSHTDPPGSGGEGTLSHVFHRVGLVSCCITPVALPLFRAPHTPASTPRTRAHSSSPLASPLRPRCRRS